MAVSGGHPGGFAEVSCLPGDVYRYRDRMRDFLGCGRSHPVAAGNFVRGDDRLSGG